MEEVFSIKKDNIRAKDLYLRAKDRFEFIPFYPEEKVYKIIEESYESIKEFFTSLMYLEGFKTLSHIKLIFFIQERFKLFKDKEIKLINTLRKFRNGTMYYGENISKDFLDNFKEDINKIIKKLISFVGRELK